MAKKKISKKPARSVLPARTFMDCGSDKGCLIGPGGKFTGRSTFPGFDYTSGRRVTKGKKGQTIVTQSTPCGGIRDKTTKKLKLRNTCPVQFFFDRGQPKLRFCVKPKSPGYTLAVSSPKEAQRIAEEACKCWRKNKKSFKKCDVAQFALGGRKRRAR